MEKRKKTTGACYLLFGLILMVILPRTLSGQSIDSLKVALVNEKSVERQIDLLKRLGDAQLIESPKEAIVHFEELVLISQQRGDDLLKSYALNKIGNCWFYLNDFKQSTQYYFKALEAAQDKAEFYELTARIYNNLGWSFKKFEDYEKALQYFLNAENYARKASDKGSLSLILNNKAVTQKDLKQYDAALVSLNESLQLNRETGNKRQERFNLNNISVIYVELNRQGEAIEKLNQLVLLNKELHDTVELINNFQNLGTAYAGMKDYQQAERFFLEAHEYCENSRNSEMKLKVLSELSSLYRREGNLQKALDYFRAFYLLSDSLKTKETARYALELETKYKSLMQEKELEKARTDLAEQKLYFTWIAAALIISLVTIIFFSRIILLKKRSEQELLALNTEIESKARALHKANEEIRAINVNMEKIIESRTETIQRQNERLREYAFMNSHKVRGPVASILGIINLMADNRNETMSGDLIKHLHTTAHNLDIAITEVNRQLENEASKVQDQGVGNK